MFYYIYLHGFASSPASFKAREIARYFRDRNLTLHIPDLNQGDFSHLTLTRQLQQVGQQIEATSDPVYLIGSSLGGLTAAWLAEQYSQIERLVLLAPAFDFYPYWLSVLTHAERSQWQQEGYRSIYHYGERRSLPLHYNFITDLLQYSRTGLTRTIPTLIVHGKQDETIPIQGSRDYAKVRSLVQLIELESDHGLGNCLPEICTAIDSFFQISS
ncbi:YqiA/YcfP family alpha/beta fold hydrolase [Roseofilum casamattae]|uniref:Alpha/beta fold hydrolase n=1 Tax=Roseofilum casamattae BLCC-M143 TaxID=3022442 RepID=A0ABT7BXN4_9CYAN|nr:YqiA/YcfP family alpha/beta fold hydrolase [Roseofilum casamattae]MDJ1183957.1 alpha/beta fold hydrolase [Roseofilum casamattae BLCC-M143]